MPNGKIMPSSKKPCDCGECDHHTTICCALEHCQPCKNTKASKKRRATNDGHNKKKGGGPMTASALRVASERKAAAKLEASQYEEAESQYEESVNIFEVAKKRAIEEAKTRATNYSVAKQNSSPEMSPAVDQE